MADPVRILDLDEEALERPYADLMFWGLGPG